MFSIKRYWVLLIYLTFGVFGMMGSVIASPTNWDVKKLLNYPPDILLKKGQDYYDVYPDSAVLYYTVLSNLYSPSMNVEEKELCLRANLDKWELAFFYYFDYSASFESLSKAKEITDDLKIEDARIPLYYGCMYHTVFEQTQSYEAGIKAYNYFKESLNAALKQSDSRVVRMAFGNLTEIAHSLERLANIKEEAQNYRNYITAHHVADGLYEITLYDALTLLDEGKIDESISKYSKLVEIAEKLNQPRYEFAAHTGMIEALLQKGDHKAALAGIQKVDSLFSFKDFQDGQLILYKLKADCYDSLGNAKEGREYRYRYTLLKDSLINYTQVSAIQSREFMDDIKDLDKKLTQEQEKKRFHLGIAIIMSIIALLVFMSWMLLRKKNRTLSAVNQTLYRKNLELIESEEKARQQRESKMQQSEAKYKSSVVSDTMREELWDKILSIMDNSEEIYSPEFSLDRLAALCDSKSKYVSQVINENGNNYNTLINSYRIRQASRLIEKEKNITIEGIANSVGFKSVNAFRTSFKKITGLTPSNYIKIAQNSEKEASES